MADQIHRHASEASALLDTEREKFAPAAEADIQELGERFKAQVLKEREIHDLIKDILAALAPYDNRHEKIFAISVGREQTVETLRSKVKALRNRDAELEEIHNQIKKDEANLRALVRLDGHVIDKVHEVIAHLANDEQDLEKAS